MSTHESKIFRYIFGSRHDRSGIRYLRGGIGATTAYCISQEEFEASVEMALEHEPRDQDADVAEMLEEFLDPGARDKLFSHFQTLGCAVGKDD